MSDKYVLATDDNGNLAVRTVTAEESPTANSTDVITATTDGKLAVRVVGSGGGGGDQHNLGWYATQSALETAHPTATDGDWAIVGSTDTVWVWDSDNNEWKDTDQKGQVTSVNGQTGAVTVDTLPTQTGQSGKFLTTDGTDASWSDKPLVNVATGGDSITICGTPTTATWALVIGNQASTNQSAAVSIGNKSSVTGLQSMAIGHNAHATASRTLAVGVGATASGTGAIQLGGVNITNSDANTFKVGNNNGNFEMMSADGTIPSDRLVHAINKYSTMPTAASTNEGWIVQYTGTTDATYTHGHLYECVSDGGNPATYSWSEVSLGGGGSSLPDQTGNAGKFLTTDGTEASWAAVNALQNTATGTKALQVSATAPSTISTGLWSVAVGEDSYTKGTNSVAIGRSAYTNSDTSGSIVIGTGSNVLRNHCGCIVIGGQTTSQGAGTFAVGLSTSGAVGTWNTYKVLDSDGTIPAARHASLPAADGTYTLQLVIADGVPTLSWVAV